MQATELSRSPLQPPVGVEVTKRLLFVAYLFVQSGEVVMRVRHVGSKAKVLAAARNMIEVQVHHG